MLLNVCNCFAHGSTHKNAGRQARRGFAWKPFTPPKLSNRSRGEEEWGDLNSGLPPPYFSG